MKNIALFCLVFANLGFGFYVGQNYKQQPKPTTWCFQAGENVGRVEEYEKYLVIFDNATGDFLQAGPVEIRNSINLLFATVDCK